MNSQQKEVVNGNTTYKRLYNVRRANHAVLENKRRTIPETNYSKERKTDTKYHRSLKSADDIMAGTDMPPVEETKLRRDEQQEVEEMQSSIPEKESKPRFSVWSRPKDKNNKRKPAVDDIAKDSEPSDKNKTTDKTPEKSKDKQRKQTEQTGSRRLTQAGKPLQKSVHKTALESEPRSTELKSSFPKKGRPERLHERNGAKETYHNPFLENHDHTLHQHLIRDMYNNMKSVGHIKFYNKLIGTVFRVGSHYLMTAWHVIRFIINPYMRIGVSDYNWMRLKSQAVCVDFGDEGGPPFTLTGRYIYSNIKLDIAVVEIERRGRRLPPPLALSKFDPSMIRDVYFIGYGHPSDPRKRVDPFCEILDRDDSRIKAAKETILNKSDLRTILRLRGVNPALLIRSYDDVDLNYRFAVQCVMEQGASGAPAISESDGSVVGILVSGVPYFYYELERNSSENLAQVQSVRKKYKFELCTKISSVYEILKYRRIDLAEDIFHPRLHLP